MMISYSRIAITHSQLMMYISRFLVALIFVSINSHYFSRMIGSKSRMVISNSRSLVSISRMVIC